MNKALPKRPGGKTSGLVRFLIVCAILAGVGVVTIAVVFSVWRWRLARSVDAKVAAIKIAGLPVNWQDLSKWPVSVPDSENAAFIYTDAIAQLDDKSMRTIEEVDDVLQYREPVSATMHEQFELAVRTNAMALNIIKQVTNPFASRYPINYLGGPLAKLPHLAGLKALGRLLACDAILKAQESNATSVSDDIHAQLNLSHSLDFEPIAISQVVSAEILTESCQTLEEIFSHIRLSDEQLSQLESQFTAAEATNRFLTAMIGERAFHNEFIRLAQDDPQKMVQIANGALPEDGQSELPGNSGTGWRFIGFFERDRNFHLEGMVTNLAFIRQGPPVSLAMSDFDDAIGPEAAKHSYIFSSIFLPLDSDFAERDALTRSELRDTIAAIALERWRLRHQGALPDSLRNLVPTFLLPVPADPFDGKPLRYKKLKNGFCIYSVGPNLQDDSGREKPPPSARAADPNWQNYDIVFTVER